MRKRLRWLGLIPIALFVFMLWRADWDIRYLGRVLWHRDSSTHDFEWKAHRDVAANHPKPWPTNLGACPALDMTDTLAFVIVRAGVVTCEQYATGGAKDKPAMAFSATKIVTSLLLSRSGMPLDSSITKYVPELGHAFDPITLASLVDMRSGIAFDEDAHFPWVDQDATRVYHASDLEHAITTFPRIEAAPGAKFVYNDYAPNLNGLAMQRATKQDVVAATQKLWDELGAEDPAIWLVDGKGFAWHESGFVVTARDLAKIGQLVIDHPDDPWVVRSHLASPVVENFGGIEVGYRNAGWTLGDDLVAMGRWGQIMVIDSQTKTVVVRMGWTGGGATNIQIAQQLARIARGS